MGLFFSFQFSIFASNNTKDPRVWEESGTPLTALLWARKRSGSFVFIGVKVDNLFLVFFQHPLTILYEDNPVDYKGNTIQGEDCGKDV